MFKLKCIDRGQESLHLVVWDTNVSQMPTNIRPSRKMLVKQKRATLRSLQQLREENILLVKA
jgi:hypothetical protein